ncbi:hypothetical protein NU08_3000 [Flavobacterium anhuiense]|uniref:Uncharacterized protein n=1 Tax=Flavobacterium anhuiense TaxID=459526 RepID=A0A444VWY9_9FLAO|nr:hypothetical protein NU08_3000 [Flavobacterium anhuiense]
MPQSKLVLMLKHCASIFTSINKEANKIVYCYTIFNTFLIY